MIDVTSFPSKWLYSSCEANTKPVVSWSSTVSQVDCHRSNINLKLGTCQLYKQAACTVQSNDYTMQHHTPIHASSNSAFSKPLGLSESSEERNEKISSINKTPENSGSSSNSSTPVKVRLSFSVDSLIAEKPKHTERITETNNEETDFKKSLLHSRTQTPQDSLHKFSVSELLAKHAGAVRSQGPDNPPNQFLASSPHETRWTPTCPTGFPWLPSSRLSPSRKYNWDFYNWNYKTKNIIQYYTSNLTWKFISAMSNDYYIIKI